MLIDLADLLKNKYTYLNRNGNSHKLNIKLINNKKILVSFKIAGKIDKIISRVFPRYIKFNERFAWVFGFFAGEGLKSIEPTSSIYRFAVTNNDPTYIRKVINVLDETKLLRTNNLPTKCIIIKYGKKCNKSILKSYWSKNLKLSKDKIKIAKNSEEGKKAKYGTATLCVSNLLLRRVFDLINECFLKIYFKKLNEKY